MQHFQPTWFLAFILEVGQLQCNGREIHCKTIFSRILITSSIIYFSTAAICEVAPAVECTVIIANSDLMLHLDVL